MLKLSQRADGAADAEASDVTALEVGSGAWLGILIIGFRHLNGKYIPPFLHLFLGQNPCFHR